MANISLTFHGHATFTVDVDGTKIVVDPFFGPDNPAAKINHADVSADYILVTHGHGDHIAHAIPIAKRTGAKVISNFEIVGWLGDKGVANAHPQHIGGGFQHEFGRVKLTIAFHGSGLPDGSYGGTAAGLLLTIDGRNIYIAGDTALFSDMKLIGEAGIDVAVLPIGDNFTMGPDDALRAVQFLNPKVVIPCHYNTWPPIAQDVGAWGARVKAATEAKVVILDVEDTYTL